MRPATVSETHVAVVYVHGMGEQRRHEDAARLATRLAWRSGSPDTPYHPIVEPIWDPGVGPADARPRTLASFSLKLDERTVRFHDVYWAPLVAGQTNFRSLYRWLRAKYLKPIQILCARWASHAHLKIETLHEGEDQGLSPVQLRLVTDYLD